MSRDKRESNAERRGVTRSGRRQTDPVPRCPSCGLPLVTAAHGSDTACNAALRGEIDSLRKGLDRGKGNRGKA